MRSGAFGAQRHRAKHGSNMWNRRSSRVTDSGAAAASATSAAAEAPNAAATTGGLLPAPLQQAPQPTATSLPAPLPDKQPYKPAQQQAAGEWGAGQQLAGAGGGAVRYPGVAPAADGHMLAADRLVQQR
eukprot:XP_001690655.1 predicted protein [Chlamydomonas reinhardtii]